MRGQTTRISGAMQSSLLLVAGLLLEITSHQKKNNN